VAVKIGRQGQAELAFQQSGRCARKSKGRRNRDKSCGKHTAHTKTSSGFIRLRDVWPGPRPARFKPYEAGLMRLKRRVARAPFTRKLLPLKGASIARLPSPTKLLNHFRRALERRVVSAEAHVGLARSSKTRDTYERLSSSFANY